MLNKKWLSMLNLARAELGAEFADAKIYYCPYASQTRQAMIDASIAVHRCDRLPWPSDKCIIACECIPFMNNLYVLARHTGVDIVTMLQVSNSVRLLNKHKQIAIQRYRCDDYEYRQKTIIEQIKIMFGAFANEDGAEALIPLIQSIRDIYSQAGQYVWAQDTSQFSDGMLRILSSWDVVYALGNLVAPCGYKVKSHLGGVGCSGLRKKNSGQPLLAFVNFDRLYIESGCKNGRHVDPHERKGHYRYFWKEAGINRHTLPLHAPTRLSIAKNRNVRNKYINPTWVGPRHYTQEGIDYEIEQ